MAKKIVLPGDLLSEERKRLGNNVFVSEGKIYSNVVGVYDDEKDTATVVPLEGKYNPRVEDSVVGIVTRVIHAGYNIDINSYSESFIPRSMMRTDLRLGDIIFAKVSEVDEMKEANLSYPKKVFGGEIIEINAVRSPRLIGKNGSMLDLLTESSDSEVFVGKNGRVWAKGGDIEKLKKIIKFVEENSYKSNLTNSVEAYVKKNGGKK
jgi:exosome complex component RRP4